MTPPPWMRLIQQSWTYFIVVAALIGAARLEKRPASGAAPMRIVGARPRASVLIGLARASAGWHFGDRCRGSCSPVRKIWRRVI
jgi:hypothetical protein